MTTSSTIRAFRLSGGRWLVEDGYRLSRRAAACKRRGDLCFLIRDGVLQSVTPATLANDRRLPALLLDLIDELTARGTPFGHPHARWLRKIARLAVRYGYGWRYQSYRPSARSVNDPRYGDSEAFIPQRRFATNAIAGQCDYLSALHEIGHLRSGRDMYIWNVLQEEAAAWEWAFAHAGEQIQAESFTRSLGYYRSYLGLYRACNRRRHACWPVPQEARRLVARLRPYDTGRHRLSLVNLVNGPRHARIAA